VALVAAGVDGRVGVLHRDALVRAERAAVARLAVGPTRVAHDLEGREDAVADLRRDAPDLAPHARAARGGAREEQHPSDAHNAAAIDVEERGLSQ